MALADMPFNFEEVVFVETQRICAALVSRENTIHSQSHWKKSSETKDIKRSTCSEVATCLAQFLIFIPDHWLSQNTIELHFLLIKGIEILMGPLSRWERKSLYKFDSFYRCIYSNYSESTSNPWASEPVPNFIWWPILGEDINQNRSALFLDFYHMYKSKLLDCCPVCIRWMILLHPGHDEVLIN